MASVTHNSSIGSPSNKLQDGPYQIELADIESDETNETNTTTGEPIKTHLASPAKSTNAMKPENHFVTGHTTGEKADNGAPPSRASTYLVRACVCAFAILLLWITSLNLSKVFVVSVINSPDTQEVVKRWDYFASTTSYQKDTYSLCSVNTVYRCNNTLYTATARMLASIAQNTTKNAATLQAAKVVSQACSDYTIELSTSIKLWKDQHPFNEINYNASCSATDISNVKIWVDRPDLIRNPAYVLAGTYSDNVDARSNRMLGYAENFTDYNQAYIARKLGVTGVVVGNLGSLVPGYADAFANITLGVLAPAGKLVDCMSMAASAATACPNGARAAWNDQTAAVQQNYQTLKDKLTATSNLYISSTQTLGNALSAVKSFFDSFLAPSASAISSIGINLGNFPSTSFSIPPPPTLGSDIAWLDPGFTAANISQYFGAFGAAVQQSALASRQAAAYWYANQSAITTPFNGMFSDYNPPPLVPEMQGEVDDQQAETNTYRTQTAFALNQQATSVTANVSVTEVKGYLSQQAGAFSPISFNYQSLGGNLLLAPLLDVIPNLYVLALAIDYVWRGYRSVRLIIKYWFQSAIGLPVIDVRDYENHAGASGPVKAASVLTHPVTIATVLLLILALALASIVPPYTSIVDAYVEGCITTDDGTILSNNSFAVAYNYATSDGNKVLTEGYQQYDTSRNEICGRYLQSSGDGANSDQTTLDAAVSSQQTNAAQTFTINRCVNFTTFGPVSAWNDTFYGGRHPLLVVQDAIDRFNSSDHLHPCMPLAMTMFNLLPALFNCSELPPCTSGCNVLKDSLNTPAKLAGCETEYLVHSFIARFGITILVFVSLNLSRMLFMAAIVRLGWRSLTPRGFEYVSNCTRVGETSKTINQQLVVQLNKAIANYERFAIFLFGLAILVHVPYIVILSTINSTLEYTRS